MKVVIAGGTGQIGQMLKREYLKRGYEVAILTRSPQNKEDIKWDAKTLGPWTAELEGADWLVNLAGRTVNCRYTDENMKQMMDSRIESTAILGKAIEQCQNPPNMWFQMSTATIYAHTFDKANDEFTGVIGGNEPDVPRYWDYSIEIGKNWEKTMNEANTPKTHKVALRAAMVMSPDKGGVFKELSRIAMLGLGGSIAGGKQYMSWIHEQDFVRALDFIAENKMEGPVNLSSPNPLTQKDFMKDLRGELGQPIGLPATKWMAKLGAFFLRTDTELVLKSRKVIPGKLTEAGFKFKYETWKKAVSELADRAGNRLIMHFCVYAILAYLFTISLVSLPGFFSWRTEFAYKFFFSFIGQTGIFLLISLGIVRRTIGKKIYTKKEIPQTKARTLFWTYLAAFTVIYLTWTMGTLIPSYYGKMFLNQGTMRPFTRMFLESSAYSLFAMAYSLPGVLIFGTWLGLDAHKKLYGVAYQR